MPDLLERITIDPDICHGRPTLRGLRYTVEMVLELLSSGMSILQTFAQMDDDLGRAAEYVLAKNEELYRRLS